MTSQTNPSSAGQGPSRKERRAAERSAGKPGSPPAGRPTSSNRSMWLLTGAIIAVALLVIVGLVIASGGFADDETPAVAKPEEPAPAAELRVGRSLGDPEAPVRIDVFEDPQCPACGLYTKRIEPLLIAGPVTDGQVFLTYKDYPFIGQESLDAAVAMRVAEEMDGKFWDFHQLVFHNQQGENQGAFTIDRLADMAELLGLDRAAFLDGDEGPGLPGGRAGRGHGGRHARHQEHPIGGRQWRGHGRRARVECAEGTHRGCRGRRGRGRLRQKP